MIYSCVVFCGSVMYHCVFAYMSLMGQGTFVMLHSGLLRLIDSPIWASHFTLFSCVSFMFVPCASVI